MLITSAPDTPTEIIGSAATPTGGRNVIKVEQPQNTADPFGYIAPQNNESPPEEKQTFPTPQTPSVPVSAPQNASKAKSVPLVSQSATVNPEDMNPLHYQNQIENTIYQEGDRLIDVQSIPLKDISATVQPNIQPTITDYPSF